MDREKLKEKAQRLPDSPGVYQMLGSQGQIIYIGKAKNLHKRVLSYFTRHQDSEKTAAMTSRISDIAFIATATEKEALLLEANLIKQHNPRYNIQLRDSKQFPWLRITAGEDFPRIIKTRLPERPGERSFGPYPNVKGLIQTIKLLHRLFPLRYCNRQLEEGRKNGTVCLYYHIRRCPGPCELLIDKAGYRKGVEQAILFLEGAHEAVLAAMAEAMHEHTLRLEYEQAAVLRDKMAAVRSAVELQTVHRTGGLPDADVVNWQAGMGLAVFATLRIRGGKLCGQELRMERHAADKPDLFRQFLSRHIAEAGEELPAELVIPTRESRNTEEIFLPPGCTLQTESGSPERKQLLVQAARNAVYALEEAVTSRLQEEGLKELGRILRLARPPEVIEGFDIATTMGEETVAGMVYFHHGKPVRSRHRHFIMRTVEGQDDFASLREAVARRYQRLLNEEQPLPDLILIDGGKGQLAAALDSLRALGLERQPVAALAKKEELIFVPWQEEPLRLDRHHFPLRILQTVRDAVHDHVNSFHRKRRTEKRVRTGLLSIPGVGKRGAGALLAAFGSMEGVAGATTEALARALGNRPLAARVHDWFHPDAP